MEDHNKKTRRDFFRKSLEAGLASAAGLSVLNSCSTEAKAEANKIKVLTTDGKLVEIDSSLLQPVSKEPAVGEEAREGIPGRKFVMVIDLGRCKNAGKCTENCQKGHDLASSQKWMQVLLMKDNEVTAPYWMPKPCFHCDNPPCVKVCPVDATFKRQDGIVLVDNERCIGCKFCMSACPYSARIFNWEDRPEYDLTDQVYSPETSVPGQVGTVGKCDFCPDLSREGKLPHCVTGCPMGAIYFGDANEDAVSNGTETVRFKKLLADRAGYRYLEELGTEPRVYYLPPTERMFPYERGFEDMSEEEVEFYKEFI
ncbi:MAG: 4Fe-4S dicluster domain-containing protein [Saprospiraceae bacterium]|nr:4Fe-4S dicluster domain-containing protein [Saprospiraceae bacterium]